MSDHIVTSFDDDLKDLARRITEIGGMAERAVDSAVQALIHVDVGLAQTVIEEDRRIDALQRDIEEKAILTIARRQPMAHVLAGPVDHLRRRHHPPHRRAHAALDTPLGGLFEWLAGNEDNVARRIHRPGRHVPS